MNRISTRLALLAAALSLGCGQTTSSKMSSGTSGSSSAAAGGTSGPGLASGGAGTTGAATTGSNPTASGSTGGATTGMPTGSSTTGASTASTTASAGTSGGNCYDSAFVGAGNAALCCSGQEDASGYCIPPGTSTGSATTGGGNSSTTGSSTTSGTGSGTTTGGGLFGGGWHPADAGYQPADVGDGGNLVVIGTGASSSAPGQFGGADDPNNKPSVVYPPDGVLVPPNMNALEVQWIPGSGQTLFELSFHAPTLSWTVYTPCNPLGSGCYYTLGSDFWTQLVPFARGTSPVTFTIRGVNGSSPGSVGTSAQRSIAFSDQDITGGIYFWNTSGIIERYDWGLPGSAPETWMDPGTAGATFCVGCHAMSRGGDKAAVGKDIPGQGGYGIFDVSTRQQLFTGSGVFFSFSPDGNLLLVTDGISVSVRDLVGGSTRSNVIPSGTMPDWSPSGAQVAYARSSTSSPFGFGGNPGVDSATIESEGYDGSNFTAGPTLVSRSNDNNYYPAYAPTGDWVAYNRSPSNADSFSNAAPDPDAGTLPDGELWTVPATGGAPIALAQANAGNVSWPKWAPVVDDYYGGKVMWLTFTSGRAYGLRYPQWQKNQLWMVAFDPARAAAGQDPSFPAFYLPFQDSGGGNHIAQWVTTVHRQGCTTSSDCPTGDVCNADHQCAPPVINH